eukprot:CAMPEP_0118694408 /NCGR_PEP_ID=MMETSP0800-20121206/12506_1 /TAXON_ID=210618 ORGANISM="Striatella unipunctata, Strain CCMP2910" /NCGR_SAMPLE_ID=MMETSP0800 /ASSEMBLY_ACC=CAM_ASM_000638 /LENGTH=282 /DNA_ID=CAMNT_0006592869 /DNA_START=65 /DNA_END=913 /DNA_ORIENTATION=-
MIPTNRLQEFPNTTIASVVHSNQLLAPFLESTRSVENIETQTIKKHGKTTKKKAWTKPKDKPKRPLSAYNIFFQQQREHILSNGGTEPVPSKDDRARKNHKKSHGKIGFADLAKAVAQKWKTLQAADKVKYEEQAAVEKNRYKMELTKWNESRRLKTLAEFTNAAQMHVPQYVPQVMPHIPSYQSVPPYFERNQYKSFGVTQLVDNKSQTTIQLDDMNDFFSGETDLSLEDTVSPHCTDPISVKSIVSKATKSGFDDQLYNASLNDLLLNLDDECLDFLSQI